MITKKLIKRVLRKRRYRQLMIVDIAVPRDVADNVSGMDGVFVFNIDDLQGYLAENLRQRAKEAEAAVTMLDEEVLAFEAWSRAQTVVPTIRNLREHFAAVGAEEAEKAAAQIAREDDAEKRAAMTRRLGDRIANRLLHSPMLALKSAEVAQIDSFVELTRELFGLKEEAEQKAPAQTRDALETAAKKVE